MNTDCTEQRISEYIKRIDSKYGVSTGHDPVNKPKHYVLWPEHNLEVRDLMVLLAEQMDFEGYSGILISDYIQMMQYLLRWHKKNGKEDIAKAKFYLEKMLEQLEEPYDKT